MPDSGGPERMVAYCGIYCASCGKLLKGNCRGCLNGDGNEKCQVIGCCQRHHYRTCAECGDYLTCDKFSNYKNRKDNLTEILGVGLAEWGSKQDTQ